MISSLPQPGTDYSSQYGRSLPLELLTLIFSNLCELPVAHRPCWTEPARPSCQSALAALVRTSKTFSKLSSPFLYRYPAVRSLPLFVVGINAVPVNGLDSKLSLLGRVERLFLDFLEEEDHSVEVDEAEVRRACIARSSSSDATSMDWTIGEVRRMEEAEGVHRALRIVLDMSIPGAHVFPKLHTLSIGALRGTHITSIQWPNTTASEAWSAFVRACQYTLHDFIVSLPNLASFCQSGDGPFSVTAFRGESTGRLTITTHSTVYGLPALYPTCFSTPTRWILHSNDDMYQSGIEQYVGEKAIEVIGQHLVDRFDLLEDLEPEEDPVVSHWSILGGLYVGVPETYGRKTREEATKACLAGAAKLNASVAELVRVGGTDLPRGMVVRDLWEVKSLPEAKCSACSWSGEGDGARRPPGWDDHVQANVDFHNSLPTSSKVPKPLGRKRAGG